MNRNEPDSPETERLTADSSPESGESRTIGPYRILRKVGEGGMGEVYEAEQTEPVRRRVALKIIKHGMDTKRVVARFEVERQALAMMDHPCIAKVFDAGQTPEGRPYFAMEYVQGIPITNHCDTHRLIVKDRLRLFQKVCEGVQHAHQKAIIHRDLKPSNILVAIQGDEAVPKIIDFGVAKATAQRLTERTLCTELGVLIGTPEYMSPEQAEMTGQDIDTRTDVYSLGVVLYELLVGALPFEPKELRDAGLTDMHRIIREQNPPRPSTRVSSLGEISTESAKVRGTEPQALVRRLRGDLDWISMKALEKDRTRRYGSPVELDADIQRYLDDAPVVARPPSTSYRLAKFVRRHRVGVVSAAAALASLLVFAAVTFVQANRIAHERDRAESQAVKAGAVSAFLDGMLSAADPWTDERFIEIARDTKVVDVLAKASQEIGTAFPDQLEAESAVRMILGKTYRNLGLYDSAELELESALELRRRELGDEHPDTLSSMDELAVLYGGQGRYEEAETLLSGVLESRRHQLATDHVDVLRSLRSLAGVYSDQGRYDEAEALLVDSIAGLQTALGTGHPETLESEYELGALYWRQGRVQEAESRSRENMEARRHALGEEHPDTLTSANQLALIYIDLGRYEEAEPLALKVLESYRRVLGEEHPYTLVARNNLATLYDAEGRLTDSERVQSEALEIGRRVLGMRHPWVLTATGNLARVLQQQSRYDEAEPLFVEALEGLRATFGEDYSETLRITNNLASMYREQGRCARAVPLYSEALAGLRRAMPVGFFGTGFTLIGHGQCLVNLGRYAEAEASLVEALGILQSALGEEHEGTLSAIRSLAELYEVWGKPEKAAEYRAKLPRRP